jgi:hypothetical protein
LSHFFRQEGKAIAGKGYGIFFRPLSQQTGVFVGSFHISIGRLLDPDCPCLWIPEPTLRFDLNRAYSILCIVLAAHAL